MALTSTVFWEVQTTSTGGDITSTSRTYNAGELIVVSFCAEDNTNAGNLSISNSGTAQTWTNKATTNTALNCKVALWQCVMSVTQAMTITVLGDGGTAGTNSAIAVVQHAGQHATDPVPAGNVFSGTGAQDVSQSITPTSVGSALFMLVGDWNATNSFAAIANCTLGTVEHDGTSYTTVLIQPTTQPRPNTSAFSIGETDTSGTIAWIAWEVQAHDAPTITTQPANATVYRGQTANFTVSATGTGTLHYQWKDDGANVGTDSNSYTTAATVDSDNGAQITCDVSDDNGTTTTSAATLTVLTTANLGWFRA
jgi:hypothetical protein